jgi:integrase/recombinase XerD
MFNLKPTIQYYLNFNYTLSKRTKEIYQEHLIKLDQYIQKPVETITSDDLIYFMAGLHKANNQPYSTATLDQVYRTLKTFFNFCQQKQFITHNPIKTIKRPIVTTGPKPRLSLSQITELLRVIKQTSRQVERNLAIVLLMVDSGLRISEVVELTVSDLHLNEKYAYIRTRKTHSTRDVPLSEPTCTVIAKYLAKKPPASSDQVFLSSSGPRKNQPVTEKTISELIKRLKRHLNFKLYPHLLRHTFGNHYIRHGGLKQLQKILGHSTIQTTAKFYTDPDFPDIQAEHEKAAPTSQIKYTI